MSGAKKPCILLLALACAAPAARADWLVTTDGGKFETRGGWQTKGKLVVFTLPNGTLSSLRSEKVDFAASQRATEQARKEASDAGRGTAADQAKAAEAQRPKKKSAWVLTDKDFKKPEAPASTEDAADSDKAKNGKDKAPSGETAPAAAGSVQVLGWDRVEPPAGASPTGIQLSGKVRNVSTDHLTEISIFASFYDEAGTLIAKVPAQLGVTHLPAGEVAVFNVSAPGIFSFAAVKWDVQGRGFKSAPPAAPNPPGQQ